MVKWRSELNEIEEAVVNKKMKVVFEKIGRLTKFLPQNPEVKSIILDKNSVIEEPREMCSVIKDFYLKVFTAADD